MRVDHQSDRGVIASCQMTTRVHDIYSRSTVYSYSQREIMKVRRELKKKKNETMHRAWRKRGRRQNRPLLSEQPILSDRIVH